MNIRLGRCLLFFLIITIFSPHIQAHAQAAQTRNWFNIKDFGAKIRTQALVLKNVQDIYCTKSLGVKDGLMH